MPVAFFVLSRMLRHTAPGYDPLLASQAEILWSIVGLVAICMEDLSSESSSTIEGFEDQVVDVDIRNLSVFGERYSLSAVKGFSGFENPFVLQIEDTTHITDGIVWVADDFYPLFVKDGAPLL